MESTADRRPSLLLVIAGAALLAEAMHDPAFRQIVRPVLQARVTRPIDRAVIADLLDG